MSNDPNENSSDLGLARTLARRLRSRPRAHIERASGPPRPRYVRFDAGRFGTGAPGVPAGGENGELERWASDSWKRLLDDCLALCQGSGAFLMDEQGLVVARGGLSDAEAVDVLAARLTVTFQQAERMSHREGGASTICIELDEGWLTGLKVPIEGTGPLVVGLIADGPVSGDTKEDIYGLVAAAASR